MPGDLEYNPAESPVSIGLYGARYTITFYPGKRELSAWHCLESVDANTFLCRCGLSR